MMTANARRNKMKILITGSEGVVGQIVKKALSEHELTLIDRKFNIDILKDDISKYFHGVDLVIHLAANPRPWINAKEAQENVLMMWNVLDACISNKVERIIFSSSVHVYDFNNLHKEGKKITKDTPLKPNVKKWEEGTGMGLYSISKIMCENLLKQYNEGFGIKYLNLRIGGVNAENKPYTNHHADFSTWLSHEDLIEIINKAVNFEDNASFVCISDNSGKLFDLSPLKEALGYSPKSNL
jgi:nucleoside-diphosphate-sugar epimerase